MKNSILKYAFICMSAGTLLTSCSNDFIETEFFQSIEQRPLVSIEELESTVRGQYNAMRSASYYGCDFPMIAEIRSDNMFSNNASGYYNTVSNYSMLSNDAYASGPYTQMYRVIALANTVINNQPASPLTWKASADPAVIAAKANYLKGQSYAARALALFDALRLYGQEYAGGTLGVVIPTKYDPTALQARSSVAETRAQIESDFNQAIALMSPTLDTTDKTVLNTISVKTLMSRYYLYKGDYAKVRTLVNEIVTSNKYSVIGRGDYANSFRSTSAQNSMFELAIGTLGDLGTTSTSYKLLVAPNGYGNMKVLSALRLTYSTADIRLNGGVTTPGAPITNGITTGLVLNGKYANTFDNIKLVRYEEALLNGAEAELNGGDPIKAKDYYNLILQNRILNYVPVASVTLNDIYLEKRKEFVGEGFGMFDLLRRGQPITQRNTSGAAGTVRNVGNNLLAFPIPRAEINVPGTPVVQNPGYSN